MRWTLRKLGVDEWLIHTVMTYYTEACIVVKTDADNMQFGFMPDKGTTDAIFIMRQV